ncbi:MAG: hypothetical protein PSX79_07925 [bacterium]|nr:hypothetical protein [bacterium]
MAQRSEHIEALIAFVEDVVTEYYATAVVEARDVTKDGPATSRLKTAEQMARAGRHLKLFRASGRRVVKAIDALPRSAVAPDPEEAPMDAPTEWTPERIRELHAEVRRRMAKLVESRETKSMAGEGVAGPGRGLPAEPHADGTPPTPPD